MNGMKKVAKIGKIIGVTFLLIGFLSACIYFTINDDGGKKKATSDYTLASANDYSGVVACTDTNNLNIVAISDIATSSYVEKSFSRYDTKVTSRRDSSRMPSDEKMNPENVPSVVASIEKEIQQEIADKGKVDLEGKVEKVIDILENEGKTDVIPKYLGKDEEKQKEYLKDFIKASYSTKFPDLNRGKSELDGIIKFKRENDYLEYMPYDEFVELVNENNDDSTKYFSLKYENQTAKLILASWSENEEGERSYYILNPINYQRELNLFSMPFDFIWAMLVVSHNENFAYDLANLAIKESSIIEITIVDTEISYGEEEELEEGSDDLGTQTSKENIVNIVVTKADTWLLQYEADYEIIIGEENEGGEDSEGSEADTEANTEKTVKLTVKTPKVKEKLDKDSDEENFVTIFNKKEYTSMRKNITSGAEWLYEILRESEDTVDMVDTVKYILYKATNNETFAGVEMNWAELVDFSGFGNSFSYTNGSGFWWPIGSRETEIIDGKLYAKGDPTTTNITSYFYSMEEGIRVTGHGAIDIAEGGTHYIIASADGTVRTAIDTYTRPGSLEGPSASDGGGWGNHVIIDHGNGVYTIYAHLKPNSVPVSSGDVVKQGQVIGEMGHTGRSTGQHLHLEIRVGSMARENRVDPLEYVDPEKPRPVASGSFEALKGWLAKAEGGQQYITAEGWIVFDPEGPDDTMNLAFGTVIANYNGGESWYPDIIPGKVYEGDIISEEKALSVWEGKKLKTFLIEIEKACMKYNVTLNSYQRDACISFVYRIGPYKGNADNLIKSYAEGGNKGLWNFMKTKTDSREIYVVGSKNRLAEEYELFTTGDYTFQYEGTAKYDMFCRSN